MKLRGYIVLVVCLLLTAASAVAWVRGRNRMEMAEAVGPSREVGIGWTDGRVVFRWLLPTGGRPDGRYFDSVAVGDPSQPDQWLDTDHHFAGFGITLDRFHPLVWGEVVIPLWCPILLSLSVCAAAWVRWRLSLRRGFPVIESVPV